MAHSCQTTNLQRSGVRFFELVCEQDLEGIIAKPKTSRYPFTWIKVKNPNYSQAAGRREWFNACCPNDKNHRRASSACFFRSQSDSRTSQHAPKSFPRPPCAAKVTSATDKPLTHDRR
jgi:hypothetical protein